ncbi:hypothetical protein ACFP3Q_06210 [Nocardioides sp. GCM10027113]|uniref:hypothetical protein n=1 Tax=unclassified Nocardioides TaxID=2615069 RepID=UPI0036078B31
MTREAGVLNKKTAIGGAALGLLLSGCGGGFADQSAQEITDAAAEDMKALSSVRVQGDIQAEGQEISLDMRITTEGSCDGTISVMGGTAEIRSTGDQTWFRPDEAFWQATAGGAAGQIMSLVGDKWVVMPPEQADVASFCDLDELLDEVEGGDDNDVTKGETEEVDGEEAVIVEGETDEGDPVKAWVAVDGEHYILKMEVEQGDEPGTITFSEFDEELEVEAPPEEEVIDLAQLAG